MSAPEFDIVFRGDIVFGHQMADVKLKLQQLFKVDATKIDALFTGRPVPLKRNLDEATAQKYRDALIKAGAMVELSPSDKGINSTPISKSTAPISSAPSPKTEWTLAPTGSVLMPLQARPTPPPIQVIDFGLRPAGSNLLDNTEIKTDITPPVKAPDYGIAALGTNLGDTESALPLPTVEFDIADWDLAEAGSNLLRPEEQPLIAPTRIDVSQFDLAPAGSDLGQIKPAVKAVVPDISGIRLAD